MISIVFFILLFAAGFTGYVVFRSLLNQVRRYLGHSSRNIRSKWAIISLVVISLIPSLILGFSSTPDTDIVVPGENPDLEGALYSDGERIGVMDENEVSIKPGELGDSVRLEYTSSEVKYEHTIDSSSFEVGESITLPDEKHSHYLLHFYIEGANSSLEQAEVSQDEEKIGELNSSGHSWIPVEDLDRGRLYLTGETDNSRFNYTFEFNEENARYYVSEFYIPEEEWKTHIHGGAETLDLSELRQHTLEFVNQARRENYPEEIPENNSDVSEFSRHFNPVTVEFSEALNQDAQSKTEEMREQGYYSHTNLEGVSVGERLQNKEIAHLVRAEDLTGVSNLSYNVEEETVAREAVDSLLGSPSHRSSIVDRDDLYTDVGIGYSCQDDNCLAAIVLSKMKRYVSTELEEDYCWKVPVHEKGLGLDYSMDVDISMRTTGSLDSYLVSSESEYEECVEGDRIDSVKEWSRSSGFTNSVVTEPGYHMVFSSNSFSNTSVKIDYTN